MSTVIAPWFTSPELLADFLTDSYNSGGSISLLALSGVFYLIQERNLDYPSFYTKLYSLLDREILHSKHRSRFLRLMDTFLASTHLPAALVASFVKRLARLSLNAPPSAIVFVVPWMYNILKSHPLCTFMIHRDTRGAEIKEMIENGGLSDPYIPHEADPMETRAIDSCLWEIVQLQSHYHPNVATIAKIISEQFTKQSYNLEDFLDHSYSSVSDDYLASTCI
jgi:U3 small nucleolar RNA-associated protein 19